MAKVLLVEDDNNLREIYEARLQAEGYTIVSAADGEEALVIAKAQKPDLVVADVMMPKISGFEMLDILRNTDGLKDVKVIMLTALGQSEDQKRADQMGADRYLVKSQVTLEDIVKATHELLGDQAAPADPAAGPAPAKAEEPAAAPVADPPAAAPPAELATDPAPKPAPPAPDPAPSSDKADGAAKSTVQEEADVEAKIEDFVAGATSEPTSPGGTADAKPPAEASDNPAPAPAPSAEPASQAAPDAAAPAKNTSSASDDKLMADAVETLVASTDKDESPKGGTSGAAAPAPAPEQSAEAPKTTVIPVSTDPDVSPVTPPEPLDKDKAAPEAAEEPKAPANVSVSHTKIIKPLEGDSKKDINALLAEEEAEEAKVAQTAPGATIVSSSSSAVSPAPANEDEDKASGQPAGSAAQAASDAPGAADPTNTVAL